MNAELLYQQAVNAIKQGELETGHKLLMQSLHQDKQNDNAWLWLSKTLADPQKQLQCIERALSINPNNQSALQARSALQDRQAIAPPVPVSVESSSQNTSPPRKSTLRKKRQALTDAQKRDVTRLMQQAERYMKTDDVEMAIEKWEGVLQIQPDQETALRKAVQQLFKLGYPNDARTLVTHAVNSGTRKVSIFLTAIDLAKHEGDLAHMEELEDMLVQLPKADASKIATIADGYLKEVRRERAHDLLELALQQRPHHHDLLMKMGEVYEAMGAKKEALQYYERAAQKGKGTQAGKEADKRLSGYVPVVTDRERGSLLLAWREALGIGIFYLVLAWQDAGLNLASIGISRLFGVLIAFLGGYLLVTATSSPQQQPIAGWLGGIVPKQKHKKQAPSDSMMHNLMHSVGLEDDDLERGPVQEPTELPRIGVPLRMVLGIAGGAILLVAFVMVFSTALQLLTANPMRMDTEFVEIFSDF